MRNVKGIKLGEDEVKSFQDGFLGSPASSAMGKVLDLINEEAVAVLKDGSVSVERLRVAQGMVRAVEMIDEMTAAIAGVNLDEEEEVQGDDNLEIEETIDVDF